LPWTELTGADYFRLLPNPLFTFALHDEFVAVGEIRDDEARALDRLRAALERLPAAHRDTVTLLFRHLHRVAQRSSVNKMTPANLGVVFGPTLLRSSDPTAEFKGLDLRARVLELLIQRAPVLFPPDSAP